VSYSSYTKYLQPLLYIGNKPNFVRGYKCYTCDVFSIHNVAFPFRAAMRGGATGAVCPGLHLVRGPSPRATLSMKNLGTPIEQSP